MAPTVIHQHLLIFMETKQWMQPVNITIITIIIFFLHFLS